MVVNIQFLRFFAALSVVIYHAAPHVFVMGGDRDGLYWLFQKMGVVGVDVFFVISGYIIWHTTEKISGARVFADFVYKRATRIYLGYWPFFIIYVVFLYFYVPAELGRYDLLDSFFITSPLPKDLLVKVAWTLRYELYFYALFSLLLFLKPAGRKGFLGLFAVSILAMQFYALFVGDVYARENFPTASLMFRFYFSPFCLEFIVGCLIAIYVNKADWRFSILLGLAALAVMLVAVIFQGQILGAGGVYEQGFYMPQRVLVFGVFAALLVWAFVSLEHAGIALVPKLSLLLGGASYSLYLSHFVILYALFPTGLRQYMLGLDFSPEWLISIVVLLIVLYSVVHYIGVEKPIMSLSRQFKSVLIRSR